LNVGFFTEPGADTPCLILQALDVSARRAAEAGLQQLAFHDNLTGLPNRRRFIECLDSAIARCRADAQHRFAVMFLDFDRFKLVNDSLGHGVGDQLLQRLARRLQENLRPGDILARLGGDEFVVLAERIETERDVIVVAERLMQSLKAPFDLDGVSLTASASIGITFSSFGYASADAVLRDADTAMYKAKGEGKARWALFDASLHTAVADRLRLEGDLRRAIEANELSVVYQPVFELASGRLTGFEALLRWAHPTQGLLGPAAFLPMAEETGLIRPLSDYVLHCACQQLRLWQASQAEWSELTMSVNVSAVDLAQPDFVGRVGRAVVEAGLKPQHLSLELTEDVLMTQVGGATHKLQELRALGLRLAVDDFGTGQSSLSHLSRLPVDCLKIDRSFIHQLQWGSDDSAVVRAIVQLGGSLRKTVVAEGIETAAQAAQLREMGCTYGQGFHLGTPLSAMDASALLQLRGRLG
jgi:diguanylate cyclase (GGDEF)-like protein